MAVAVFLFVAAAGAALTYAAFSDDIAALFAGGGSSTPLDPSEQIAILILPAIGILLLAWLAQSLVWPIYIAREMAVFASYTTLDRARFKLDATAGSLLRLSVGNVILWILTIGIATPFIQQRTIKYVCDRLTVVGTIDLVAILQSTAPLPKSGEGLADAFDVGGI